jgi:4a-hydroxytetrahydrobiopterin dehydratase
MSEQGWQEFLAAEGVDDWVVLHGGATAVFRVPSLGEAAQLAAAVAHVPGLEGSGALLTIADDRVSVRPSRGVFRLEKRHIHRARAVSAVARTHGAVADRTGAQEVQLAIAAKPDAVDVGFWRAVLGYARLADDNAIDPLGHGSTVWMQELNADKPLRHAMHLDVSVAREHVEARVAAAICRRRPHSRRRRRPCGLDPRRPRRQPRVHRRLARRVRPDCSSRIAVALQSQCAPPRDVRSELPRVSSKPSTEIAAWSADASTRVARMSALRNLSG